MFHNTTMYVTDKKSDNLWRNFVKAGKNIC